jgi:hypothetical protein
VRLRLPNAHRYFDFLIKNCYYSYISSLELIIDATFLGHQCDLNTTTRDVTWRRRVRQLWTWGRTKLRLGTASPWST